MPVYRVKLRSHSYLEPEELSRYSMRLRFRGPSKRTWDGEIQRHMDRQTDSFPLLLIQTKTKTNIVASSPQVNYTD
jgi:hypothetical protein